MNSPIVSVVIPCFRQPQYLSNAIKSVKAQTYTNWEIVIATGCDECTAEAAKHESHNIRIADKLDHGLADARNKAIELTRGCYILPLDADDAIEPTFLEKTMALAETDRTIVRTYLQFFGDRSDTVIGLPGHSQEYLIEHNAFYVSSLFSKYLWEVTGGYDVALFGYEDWNFWIACSKHRPHVKTVEEPLFRYCSHADSGVHFCKRNDGTLRAMLRTLHPDLHAAERLAQDREIIAKMSEEVRRSLTRHFEWFPENQTLRSWLEL